ncbi:MAG: choice-of-anchor C family protein [Rhizobiales bacterium]|nr:choice-of-anchor C family protein [Hyphomicrobiales bacterium]
MIGLRILPALAGAFMFASSASAAVSIVNGSFESASVNPGAGFTSLSAGSTAITGWTVGGAGVDYIGTYWQASDGVRSIDLNRLNAGSITQIVNGLTTGLTYTVKFDLAGNPDGAPTVKAAVAVAGVDTNFYTFDTTGASHSAMNWSTQSFSFVALAPTITLTFASGTAGAYGAALDNVSIAAGVPEPSTWAMMLIGFAGLGYVAQRRRRTTVAVA